MERPFLWGTFVWNMFDFASDGRSEGDSPGRNDKGLVTYDRTIRKDAFYWYKANWNPEPMVYIASRRFTPRPSGSTDVRVYTNCDSVALSVNGINAGTKAEPSRVFVWSGVQLVDGSNSIDVVGYKDGKQLRDTCLWTVPATKAKTE